MKIEEIIEMAEEGFQSRAILTLARAEWYRREGRERQKENGRCLCDKRIIVQAERRLRGVGGEKDNLTIHDVKWLQLFCATCTY